MSAALLDVNALLALAWPNHQHHGQAHRWFGRHQRKGWATCALTELAFVRLSSNPAYTTAAVTPLEAAGLLQRLTAHRTHVYWPALPAPAKEMFVRALGHQQVQDAYLVRLAEHHRGRFVTFDRRAIGHATRPTTVEIIES